jgi:hypothetical protein
LVNHEAEQSYRAHGMVLFVTIYYTNMNTWFGTESDIHYQYPTIIKHDNDDDYADNYNDNDDDEEEDDWSNKQTCKQTEY